jgi:hypothetical protein
VCFRHLEGDVDALGQELQAVVDTRAQSLRLRPPPALVSMTESELPMSMTCLFLVGLAVPALQPTAKAGENDGEVIVEAVGAETGAPGMEEGTEAAVAAADRVAGACMGGVSQCGMCVSHCLMPGDREAVAASVVGVVRCASSRYIVWIKLWGNP